MNKNAGISTLKGIGEKTEKLFLKLGVATVDDLLHYYPRTYEIFGPPVPVSEVQEDISAPFPVLFSDGYRCPGQKICR